MYKIKYEIKDSGKRVQMPGMVRDISEDKLRYDLVFDGPMLNRWAEHLTSGAKKYSPRNWMGAHTQEELERFRESAARHFVQWLHGDTDEDHAAAIFFNINGAEYVTEKLRDAATAKAEYALQEVWRKLEKEGLISPPKES